MLAELSFWEEITKELVGAVATALLVTIVGGVLVAKWSQDAEARRSKEASDLQHARNKELSDLEHQRRTAATDAEHARREAETEAEHRIEDAAMRRDVLSRVTSVASSMYVACQDTRRKLQRPGADLEALVRGLDRDYRRFAVAHRALEAELGARFGFRPLPLTAENLESPSGYVQGRWHQIADLLTVYYFNLIASFPGDVLKQNSKGTDDRFHSGLDLSEYIDVVGHSPDLARREVRTALSTMRRKIRQAYQPALEDLVTSIVVTPTAVAASANS
jgi:hypothetical protein